MDNHSKHWKVGILLFDEAEILDFAGPFEVFSVASRLEVRQGRPSPFKVVTFARTRNIEGRGGLKLTADHLLEDQVPIDLLIIPGGEITKALEDPVMLTWIQNKQSEVTHTASVCTGAFFLAKLGILNGMSATTHWEDLDDFRKYAGINVIKDVPFVDEGKILTSAGVSAGIKMSLHLIEKLCGKDLAMRTARQIEFDWKSSV